MSKEERLATKDIKEYFFHYWKAHRKTVFTTVYVLTGKDLGSFPGELAIAKHI